MASLSREIEARFASLGGRAAFSAVEESPPGRSPRSISAQLDTSACLGGLTFWESGSAFFEVVAATDGRSIARQQYDDIGLEDARSVVQDFLSCMLQYESLTPGSE